MLRLILGGLQDQQLNPTCSTEWRHGGAAGQKISAGAHVLRTLLWPFQRGKKRKKSTWLCKIITISAKRKTHAHSWNCNPQREKRKLSASRSQIEGKRGNNTLHSLQATVPRSITSHTQPLGQVWLSVTQHSCTRDTGGAHRSTISARMLCEIDDHKAV